jgi:hypothetical protein
VDLVHLVLDLLKHFKEQSAPYSEAVVAAMGAYLAVLRRTMPWLLLVLVGLTGGLAAAIAAQVASPGIYIVLTLGWLAAALGGVLLLLPLARAHQAFVAIPGVGRLLALPEVLGAIAFWGMILVASFAILPIAEEPSLVPYLILLAVLLVLGANLGIVVISPQRVAHLVIKKTWFAIAVLTVIGYVKFLFPTSIDFAQSRWGRSIDEAIGRILPKAPALYITSDQQQPVRRSDTRDPFPVINENTGDPQVWYIKLPNNKFELFAGRRYDAEGRRAQRVETPDELSDLRRWIRWVQDSIQTIENSTREAVRIAQQKASADSARRIADYEHMQAIRNWEHLRLSRIVEGSSIVLRSDHTHEGKALGSLERGDSVEVTDSTDFVEPQDVVATTDIDLIAPTGQRRVLSGTILHFAGERNDSFLLSPHETGGAFLGMAPAGKIRRNPVFAWYQVRTPTGAIGWLLKSQVRPAAAGVRP